ncbi:hypothetical protein TW65_04286 [Stemphylium lycopersici]|uniref:Uncharacterized protein n=1 Tax=Stemphylium lycopersici TaxID=183478 RepID=A0A364MZX8_STELY|nr:hypothetical protein TW65_04286 [Stemphylium lycopersici]RAR08259.1 hypothetical protein DDE83_006100 [Stemphylium lycopersici]
MADPEAPTVTPSPALSYASFDCSSVPTSPAPDHPPPDPPTRALRRGTDVIQAEQTRCGICFSWLNGKHTPQTLNHLNACWKKPKARARAEKQDFLSRSPDLSTSPAEEEEGHFHEFDMPNIIPEDEEDTTESTSSSSNSIFAEPLSPWSPPHTRTATIPPNTYCILCWRDLSSLADLDAVQHRVMCLNEQTPLSCPICRGTFVVEQFGISAFRKPQDILKHLHECQNDGDVDDATGQAFENLLEAWRGRREMVIFLFNHCNGKKRGWSTSMHLGQYTTKRDRGRKRGGSEYKADVTPLRRRERILPHYDFVIGVEVEVEVWKKEWVPKGVPLDRFKRSAFHILAPKDLAQVPRNFKEQKVANETVGRADSIGFWGRLNLNRKPAPLSSRSHLAELREGSVADGGDSPLMKGTAAENFPAIGDRPSASFQLGPKLRHPPGIMHPTTSVDVFDAILGDNTPHPSPALNPTTKLSEGQKQPMKLFYTEKERADQLLLDTTPTAENTVEPASVTLPRAVKQLPQLAFTNTPDAPGDADQNTHSLPLPGRTFRDLDLPLYRPQVNFAPRPPRIMTTTPIRLPPTEDSAVQMPRCESLQKTSPLMLPSPRSRAAVAECGAGDVCLRGWTESGHFNRGF